MSTMSGSEILAEFQAISQITDQMREAARTGEWDRLAVLERCCAGVVARLKAAQPVRLTADMQREKVELIRKILADDAEIRIYTEPWMKQVQTLLGSTGMARRVHHAYDNQCR